MSRPTERYPDPGEFDEQLYANLTKLPCRNLIDIHWIRHNIWPQAEEFNIPRSGVIRGMQANMFTLEVTGVEEGKEYKKHFLAKRIVPRELPDKPSQEIWREFVKSVRTEIDFYWSLMQPEHAHIRDMFPRVYYSSGTPIELDCQPQDTSFILVMDDLSESYFQTPMMSKDQAESVLQSMARMHAHFWGAASKLERGGFWVLAKRRKFNEVERAEETWASLLERFPEIGAEVQQDVSNVGNQIKAAAEYLDGCVEEGACTIIHGDPKGWNFFFGKEGASHPFLFIDMQWAGRGHPYQDVAYTLTTTLQADDLHQMDNLVDFYTATLKEELEKKNHNLPCNFRGTYDNVWLDYCRVIVTGLWKNLNRESIERNKTKVGPSMINRSFDHVTFITKRLVKLLNKLK